MKKIIFVMKKFLINGFVLYTYNLITYPLGLIIPINFFTLFLLNIFGLPAIFSLILIIILVY